MVNDFELIREVNSMQSVLSQQEQKEEQQDIPVADAVMEARREINMCKAYPQDVTLSTTPRNSGVVSDICPTHVSLQGSMRKYLPYLVGEGDVEIVFSKNDSFHPIVK